MKSLKILFLLIFLLSVLSVNATYSNYRNITITNFDIVDHVDEIIELKVENLILATNDCAKELLLKDRNDNRINMEIIYNYGGLIQGSQWCQIAFKSNSTSGQTKTYKLYYNNVNANESSEQVYTPLMSDNFESYTGFLHYCCNYPPDSFGPWIAAGGGTAQIINTLYGKSLSISEADPQSVSLTYILPTPAVNGESVIVKGRFYINEPNYKHWFSGWGSANEFIAGTSLVEGLLPQYNPSTGGTVDMPQAQEIILANKWYNFSQTFYLSSVSTRDFYLNDLLIGKNLSQWRTYTPLLEQISFATYDTGFGYLLLDDLEVYKGKHYSSKSVIPIVSSQYSLNINPPIINSVSPTQQTSSINELDTISFTQTSSDSDGDILTYSWLLDNIQVATTQNYNYVTDYTSAGNHNITLVVSDGFLSASQQWLINVNNVNRAPILDIINDININENELFSIIPNAVDPDGDIVSYTYSIPLDSNGQWQTDYSSSGIYPITVTASDGFLQDLKTFILTINNVGVVGTTNNTDVIINNLTNLTQSYSGTLTVILTQASKVVAEFNYNFSEAPLNITNIVVEKEPASATKAYIILRGLELQGENTKTLYMNRLNTNLNYVCIKDIDINDISEISSNCQGTDEYLVPCNGNDLNGYTCIKTAESYVITGLKHSGIIEYEEPIILSSSGSSGGGGGGSGVSSGCSINLKNLDESIIVRDGCEINFEYNGVNNLLKIDDVTTTYLTAILNGVSTNNVNINSQSRFNLNIDKDLLVGYSGLDFGKVNLSLNIVEKLPEVKNELKDKSIVSIDTNENNLNEENSAESQDEGLSSITGGVVKNVGNSLNFVKEAIKELFVKLIEFFNNLFN